MSFEKSLEFVLRYEGGYVNDPKDPGGETNFGISKRAHPNVDIKNLTKERAGEIYRDCYWEPTLCPSRPPAEALVVFDTAVNCGNKRAMRWAQSAEQFEHFIDEFLVRRAEHYASLPTFNRFGRGWMRRLIAVHRAALAMEKD